MSIWNFFLRHILSGKKYINYLRKIGVNIGEDCEIYNSAHFGSEPYLVTLGNHVRVTHGVWFITHDGGLWVLRDKNSGYGREFEDADFIKKL